MTLDRPLQRINYRWRFVLCLLFFTAIARTNCSHIHETIKQTKCGDRGENLKYVWGDALTDPNDCIGPNNVPYPLASVNRMVRKTWAPSSRTGRSTVGSLDPSITKQILLQNYESSQNARDNTDATLTRIRRDYSHRDMSICQSSNPSRLCKTRYNTTAPMYGVSLTSGQPVTIVQKFPDLLQQVIYEVCESSECDLVRGECTQTYVPYLFLVIPLGPVTLTGQDYVLVESGCVCKPKYSNSMSDSMAALPTL